MCEPNTGQKKKRLETVEGPSLTPHSDVLAYHIETPVAFSEARVSLLEREGPPATRRSRRTSRGGEDFWSRPVRNSEGSGNVPAASVRGHVAGHLHTT